VSKDHLLAKETSITRKMLGEQRLVVPSSALGLRQLLDNYMSAGGISIIAHLQIDSVPLIREVVGQGQLATLLPQSTCRLEFDSKKFTAVELVPTLTRTLYAASPKDSRRGQYVGVLMRHIVDVFAERAADS
jgi:DNA-binding transcriptional LysR family regulator